MGKPEAPAVAAARIVTPAIFSLGRSGYIKQLHERYEVLPTTKRLMDYPSRLLARSIAAASSRPVEGEGVAPDTDG